ncbi:MAG: hypothetical protein U1E77_10440 [Inhella sp.]
MPSAWLRRPASAASRSRPWASSAARRAAAVDQLVQHAGPPIQALALRAGSLKRRAARSSCMACWCRLAEAAALCSTSAALRCVAFVDGADGAADLLQALRLLVDGLVDVGHVLAQALDALHDGLHLLAGTGHGAGARHPRRPRCSG